MAYEQPYQIPFHGQQIIYKPRQRLAFLGNSALAAYLVKRQDQSRMDYLNPEIERFLNAIGYDQPGLICPPVALTEDEPHPSNAVLLMTNRCNLRCIYCYANAGSEARLAEMSWPTAKTIIDYVVTNAAQHTSTPPSLTFHGGGEPTMHWDLLVQSVEYARKKEPQIRISMSSNGVWIPDQRRFVCDHFQNISLSMDGLPTIQNAQRPCVGGGESFPSVLESIHALDDAGIEYGIRMTILPESVEKMPESVRFLCQNTKAQAIQIEPTFTSSRGQYADIDALFADYFSERFVESWRIGNQAGCMVYYSGARPWIVASMFCQAPLKAAVATADGRLVTCFEVFGEQSPLANDFTVGRIVNGHVVYDRAALQAFLNTQQYRRQECKECFCYWHCCGDCATRRPGLREANQGRCRVTQNITLAMLLTYMEDGGGIWHGLHDTSNDASYDIVAEGLPDNLSTAGDKENQ